MVHKTVYLAGPIGGLDYSQATEWRHRVKSELALHGIKCLSPMRAEVFLRSHVGLLKDCQTTEELGACGSPAIAMSTPRGITTRDRFDALNCSVLFANLLGAEKVSIGTVMEIAWADAYRRPSIVIMEEGNLHEHAMLSECAGFVVPSIREGIEIAKAILADY